MSVSIKLANSTHNAVTNKTKEHGFNTCSVGLVSQELIIWSLDNCPPAILHELFIAAAQQAPSRT